jgi:hypothetical protein
MMVVVMVETVQTVLGLMVMLDKQTVAAVVAAVLGRTLNLLVLLVVLAVLVSSL